MTVAGLKTDHLGGVVKTIHQHRDPFRKNNSNYWGQHAATNHHRRLLLIPSSVLEPVAAFFGVSGSVLAALQVMDHHWKYTCVRTVGLHGDVTALRFQSSKTKSLCKVTAKLKQQQLTIFLLCMFPCKQTNLRRSLVPNAPPPDKACANKQKAKSRTHP